MPEIYERLLVPLIFQPYAEDLAERVAAVRPTRILEVAAGTGALTRAMAARLDQARIVATDLNPAMLAIAAEQLPEDDRIAWRQADALDLPFAAESVDLVACQFGAMVFPDRRRGFAEALRVLRPGGRLLFNVSDAVARVEKRSRANAARDVAIGLCQGTPTRGEIEARGEPSLAATTEAVAQALEQRFGPGPIEGELSAFVVSAARPPR